MISEELQIELRKKYNPDGSELRLLQKHLLILLDHFDKICKENNIRYWLSSGTCLGAVRHEGFIPWDDDIDVEMLREDYLKFVDVFVPDEDFILQTYKNDLYYTEPFPKLRLKKTYVNEGRLTPLYLNKGVFLDIFVMEESTFFVAKFCHLVLGTLRHLSYHMSSSNTIHNLLFKILKKMSFQIIDMMRKINSMLKNGKLRHTIGTGVVKNIRKKEEIFPLSNALFEGKEYPIPGKANLYLKRMFGNYMEIPSTIHTHSLRDIVFLSDNSPLELK